MTAIRSIFLGLVAALFLFVFSFSFIVSWDGGDAGPFPYVALVVGLATLPLVRWVRAKPLVLNDAASLAGSWHTQLFIGVGVAELPALVGLVCAMLADVPWVYCIALPFALWDFWRIAPSRRNLELDQQRITQRGSPLNLVGALMARGGSPPRPDVQE